MTSTLLPQAMFTIPRNPTQCILPKKLGFSSPALPSPSNRLLISRVSYPPLTSSSVFISSAKSYNRSCIVRADSNPEAEPETSKTTEQLVADSEAEVEQAEEFEAEAEERPPRTPRVKLGDIMGILNKRAIEASDKERPIPDLRTGDIIELKVSLPHRKRLARYKGIIISRQNAGIHTTIRVRRIIAGIGVEIVFPIYSPIIKELIVVKHRKVRRARLYYLRDKLPRFCTFK
ncbi:hypothetical protein LguiA_034087 [Lonicera macranthoides]